MYLNNMIHLTFWWRSSDYPQCRECNFVVYGSNKGTQTLPSDTLDLDCHFIHTVPQKLLPQPTSNSQYTHLRHLLL